MCQVGVESGKRCCERLGESFIDRSVEQLSETERLDKRKVIFWIRGYVRGWVILWMKGLLGNMLGERLEQRISETNRFVC